jgi:hypothetical protein
MLTRALPQGMPSAVACLATFLSLSLSPLLGYLCVFVSELTSAASICHLLRRLRIKCKVALTVSSCHLSLHTDDGGILLQTRRQGLSKFCSCAIRFQVMGGEYWNCWPTLRLKRWRTPTGLHDVIMLKIEIPPLTLYFLHKMNCAVNRLTLITFKILLVLDIRHPMLGIHSKWLHSVRWFKCSLHSNFCKCLVSRESHQQHYRSV